MFNEIHWLSKIYISSGVDNNTQRVTFSRGWMFVVSGFVRVSFVGCQKSFLSVWYYRWVLMGMVLPLGMVPLGTYGFVYIVCVHDPQ